MPFKFLHKTFGITRKELPIIIFVLFVIGVFGSGFLRSPINLEFLIYTGIVVGFLVVLLITNKRVKYPTAVLWLLAICTCMHLAGGSIFIDGKVLYYHVVFHFFRCQKEMKSFAMIILCIRLEFLHLHFWCTHSCATGSLEKRFELVLLWLLFSLVWDLALSMKFLNLLFLKPSKIMV